MQFSASTLPLPKRLLGFFAVLVALTAAVAVVGIILGMFGNFLLNGGSHVTWEFLTEFPRNSNTEGGIWPALAGTTLLVLLMTLLTTFAAISVMLLLYEVLYLNRKKNIA